MLKLKRERLVYSNQIFKTKDQFFYSCKHKKNTTHFIAFPGQKTFATFGPGSCLVSHSQYHTHILSSFVFSSTHISYIKNIHDTWYMFWHTWKHHRRITHTRMMNSLKIAAINQNTLNMHTQVFVCQNVCDIPLIYRSLHDSKSTSMIKTMSW